MLSQNGWYANSDPKTINVVSFNVAGVNFPNGVKGGNVETVLRYVAEQFHKTVEPLRSGECWGYYYKSIEGSTTLSNHASGTAIDINAPAHPMGVRGTFSTTKLAAIRRILTYLEGVVRWGGDYAGRADEMHFEINDNAAEVARIAKKITNSQEEPMPTADEIATAVWSKPMTDPTDNSVHFSGDYLRFIEANVKQQINDLIMPKLDAIMEKLNGA